MAKLSNEQAISLKYTVPNDEIVLKRYEELFLYSVTNKTKDKYSIIELLNSSGNRIAPKCPLFTHCNGCLWQNISYDLQLKLKEEYLNRLLKKNNINTNVLQIIGSSKTYNYRSKSEYALSNDIFYPSKNCTDRVFIT